MLIQVDVDNTLYDSDKAFGLAAESYGLKWPKKYDHWFGPEFIGTDLPTLLNVFRKGHSREIVMQNKPYPNAVKVIAGIVKDFPEVEIAYVSDRNPQAQGPLRDWLEEHGFLHGEDAHVQAGRDKRDWMRERRPQVVIDDRVRTMLMARFELDSQVVSLQHEYNINLLGEVQGIHIVKDWNAIDTVLRETIIPDLKKQVLSRETELAVA